jgi:hypothetical protein
MAFSVCFGVFAKCFFVGFGASLSDAESFEDILQRILGTDALAHNLIE